MQNDPIHKLTDLITTPSIIYLILGICFLITIVKLGTSIVMGLIQLAGIIIITMVLYWAYFKIFKNTELTTDQIITHFKEYAEFIMNQLIHIINQIKRRLVQ